MGEWNGMPVLGAEGEDAERLRRTVGGFDVPPCHLCAREQPCSCGPFVGDCQCSCGRCLYPYPLPDDGPLREGEGE